MALAPPSHTFLSSTGRLSPWRHSFLALRGDNKVEMCLKRERGEGRWEWLCTEGGGRDKLKMLAPKYFKPQGSSASDKRRNTWITHTHTHNFIMIQLWGPYIHKIYFLMHLITPQLYPEGWIPFHFNPSCSLDFSNNNNNNNVFFFFIFSLARVLHTFTARLIGFQGTDFQCLRLRLVDSCSTMLWQKVHIT